MLKKILKTKNRRRFFFHYNKPASSKGKKKFITVHLYNKCFIVPADKFKVDVPTETKVNKKQPYVVVQGLCKLVEFKNGIPTHILK